MQKRLAVFLTSFFVAISIQAAETIEQNYEFDGSMSREVLCNYLTRATTFSELLHSENVNTRLGGNTDDNLRMIQHVGIKLAGRAIYMWGGESRLESIIADGKSTAARVHKAAPDLILQSAIFEIVTTEVNTIPLPAWVFEAFGAKPETRNFSYDAMLYPDGHRVNQWREGNSVPDMSQLETRMWFYYLAVRYIDIGVEAIHFGQVEIMDDRDEDRQHWLDMMTRIRQYAKEHARRHFILCDAHVPSGGIVFPDGKLLFDFHTFPLRIKAIANKPQQGVLEVGFLDSLFQRSKGGVTPSGWQCDSLPYLVELDNFGRSSHPGEDRADYFIWGYDEICWFAKQSENYRDLWLHYAWNWVRRADPNGYLQMPISRTLADPADGKHWYWANRPSDAVPGGFNQEDAIKTIWENDSE
ncbi:MAG: hypothetical protein P9L94_15405 [Candidatus Hinthialibacter antarcticus]|nr:hypothetical protein [Candidatus Hinthialibacter antarcticus]